MIIGGGSDKRKDGSDKENTNRVNGPTNWLSQVILPSSILTSSILGGFFIYRKYLRRIPNSRKIPDYFFKSKKMVGKVTSVGDADNFHFYHTPGGIFTGWGWLRHSPKVNQRKIGGQTIHIRLCGIDAPEGAHFGKPAQKWSDEALLWLRNTILGRRIVVMPLAPDQYGRTVGDATIWTWTGRKNVSAEMLRNGWAMVYEGKVGSEFNGHEELFRKLEAESKRKRIGMFQSKHYITPGEYKKMHSNKK